MIPLPVTTHSSIAWKNNRAMTSSRNLPEETPIAVSYAGSTHAVMMATPVDLDDFAVGFSCAEGAIASADEIESIETLEWDEGLELRIGLCEGATQRLTARRRRIAGPVGCGLCGLDSLAEAVRLPTSVTSKTGPFPAHAILDATRDLASHQTLNAQTRAMHAAAFWTPARSIETVREDVGRHNALDKLCGALTRSGRDPAEGVVLVTSRLSVELVQKTAILGAPVLVAISSATALAVRVAAAVGVTLVCLTRDEGFEVFTHPGRLRFADVAMPGIAPILRAREAASAVFAI